MEIGALNMFYTIQTIWDLLVLLITNIQIENIEQMHTILRQCNLIIMMK